MRCRRALRPSRHISGKSDRSKVGAQVSPCPRLPGAKGGAQVGEQVSPCSRPPGAKEARRGQPALEPGAKGGAQRSVFVTAQDDRDLLKWYRLALAVGEPSRLKLDCYLTH